MMRYLLFVVGLSLALTTACMSRAVAQPIKAPLSGLVSMGLVTLINGVPNNDMSAITSEPGVFNGVVINVAWSALEPTQGTFNTSTIDTALAAVTAYNAEYPSTPLGVRLNVEASQLAPSWAKTMDGPAVITQASPEFTIGEFWNADYQAAFTTLQTYLAGIYDTNPLINEVTNTACSSDTDEPFVLLNTSFAFSAMHAAGFTDAEYLSCLENSPNDYVAWRETPLHWSFNPFPHTDTGTQVADEATTAGIIASFRITMGPRAILANHDLQSGNLGGVSEAEFPNIALMYQQFKSFGGAINLQTYAPVQDWTDTMNYGIASGATEIEVWPGFTAGYIQSSVSQAQLLQWAAAIQANLQSTLTDSVCALHH